MRLSIGRSVQRINDVGYVVNGDFMKNTESAEFALPAMVVRNLDIVEVAQTPGQSGICELSVLRQPLAPLRQDIVVDRLADLHEKNVAVIHYRSTCYCACRYACPDTFFR